MAQSSMPHRKYLYLHLLLQTAFLTISAQSNPLTIYQSPINPLRIFNQSTTPLYEIFENPFKYNPHYQHQYFSRILFNFQTEDPGQFFIIHPADNENETQDLIEQYERNDCQIEIETSQQLNLSSTLSMVYQILLAYVQFLVELCTNFVQASHPSKLIQYEQNFASLNGGAMILSKSSSKIKNQKAILQDSKDNYMYFDEVLPIEITIALKEEVKIQTITLKSSQIYSSTIKDFVIEGSFALNQKHSDHYDPWFPLLKETAKNNNQEQHFQVKNKVVKFLRLKIFSKYGDWRYFTLTQIKVYGQGLLIEALSDYQMGYQSGQKGVNRSSTQLANDLSAAYDELFGVPNEKQPDENIITYLVGQVQKLSKISQFQIFYMHNVTKKVENISKVERQFRQHKSEYESIRKFQQKYLNRFLSPKIHQMELKLADQIQKNKNIFDKLRANSERNVSEQICLQSQYEQGLNFQLRTIVMIVLINVICTSIILVVVYCVFSSSVEGKPKQAQQEMKTKARGHIKKHNSSR